VRIPSRLLTVVVTLVGVACGDGGTGPSSGGAGPVDLILTTPYPDDGGLLISVTGARVTGVSSSGYEVTQSTPGDAGVTLLLRGNISAGVIARITVPNRGRLGRYRVTVLQAAARGPSYQLRSPGGYQVRLAAP